MIDSILKDELAYIQEIWAREEKFKNQSLTLNSAELKKSSHFLSLFNYSKLIFFSLLSIFDALRLLITLGGIRFFKKERVDLLYVAKNFCVESEGQLELRIARELFLENVIFINTSKVDFIRKIRGRRVFNLGFLIVIKSRLKRGSGRLSKLYQSHKEVNNYILSFRSSIRSVYFYWFYDMNSFSLIFSGNRHFHQLIEIQHGSIINYPPYELPAPVKIADLFYVRNESTILYLKNHLCKDFNCEYRLLSYPEMNAKYVPGINLLYASTIEFKGFHPVFKEFIKGYQNVFPSEILNLTIRLHPRERGQEHLFLPYLKEFGVNFKFDNSDNWLLSNAIEGLVVISPWSSTLEEAYDNGYKAITIDSVGRERYKHCIDDDYFVYSVDLKNTLKVWNIIKE